MMSDERDGRIDEGDEPFQLCHFVGADQDQRLAWMGVERDVELLVGDRAIVHEQFTLRRDSNDERGILPVTGPTRTWPD